MQVGSPFVLFGSQETEGEKEQLQPLCTSGLYLEGRGQLGCVAPAWLGLA